MNANQPMFIYVESDDKYAKFWLKPVQLAKSVGYSAKELNENISVEDIMYEINFVAQVLEGLKDAESGKLLTTEELLNRVEQWAK